MREEEVRAEGDRESEGKHESRGRKKFDPTVSGSSLADEKRDCNRIRSSSVAKKFITCTLCRL